MTKIADSEGFVFKYFLSCCAATIAESGKFSSASIFWKIRWTKASVCYYPT